MGLAVSQVRLLALTNRKADIECQMQIDSKRKMMLTRKSTELAQQYYSKLQCANIQYATSAGYEDVDYSYLMGQTVSNVYTGAFLDQVVYGSSYEIAQKTQNKMILTNQFGEVVANDTIARLVREVNDDYKNDYADVKTAGAILRLISNVKEEGSYGSQSFTSLYELFHDSFGNIVESGTGTGVGSVGRAKLLDYVRALLKNGGFKDGGIIYQHAAGGEFYTDLEGTHKIVPESGVCYRVGNIDNHGEIVNTGRLFYDGQVTNLTTQMATYLGNLCSYFGPILSAAIQNGVASDVEPAVRANTYEYDRATRTSFGITFNDTNAADSATIQSTLLSSGSFASGLTFVSVADKYGDLHYYEVNKDATGALTIKEYFNEDISMKFYDNYKIEDNSNFLTAMNKEKLQAGFRSGLFQLAMVDDASKGNYHKNTTLEYFTHMNYVVEKTDSSKREEITAWFNAENAAISEKETYWDTEIQNLSTELNSVTTEIDSVKQLKSNAIKSVFNWGGN